jgi:putative sigma-54 modulation protein
MMLATVRAAVPVTASRAASERAPTASSRLSFSHRSKPDVARLRAPVASAPGRRALAVERNNASRRSLVVVAAGKGTKVIVQGIHLEITDSIREYAESKINKAVSHFDLHDVREVDIRCSARGGEKQLGGDVQKTEVTVYTKNGTIRAEEEADDLYASIDSVADKLERKMRKVKEKKSAQRAGKSKTNPKDATAMAVDEAMEAEEAEDDIAAA